MRLALAPTPTIPAATARALALALAAGLAFASTLGCVDQRCYYNGDCQGGRICSSDGRCVYECTDNVNDDCGLGFRCIDHRCEPTGTTVTCPTEMVPVVGTFCIDRYEASRVDATTGKAGTDESIAHSVKGVLPWQVSSNAQAEMACQTAGKRLCTPTEWTVACKGRSDTIYSYGNSYDPTACNGIDTFGRSSFHLTPTGSFPECRSDWGAFDLNGNVWEHVASGDDMTVRGGAYNCSDSKTYHRCDYVPGSWKPAARGFRCCLSGTTELDASVVTIDGAASGIDGGGCVADAAPADGDGPTDGAVSAVDAAAGIDAARADACAVDADGGGGGDGCPPDMVRNGAFCIDRYEASRADATASSWGTSDLPSSRAGVLPWSGVSADDARAACAAAEKRLCSLTEWTTTCQGSAGSAYVYGNTYDPIACNGIDTYCKCNSEACASVSPCPYPHCYNRESPTGGGPCGSAFAAATTGKFPVCKSEHGAFDINGNVWEIVDHGDGTTGFHGGAFNCGDSETYHRCDFEPDWTPSAVGFRCCRDAQ
ncbi:MAG: SUMF1/EgtB/PvdO family nonheme iron enzyme [Pseudomonadota bacterium]